MKISVTKWLMAAALTATVSSPAIAEKWDLPMASILSLELNLQNV